MAPPPPDTPRGIPSSVALGQTWGAGSFPPRDSLSRGWLLRGLRPGVSRASVAALAGQGQVRRRFDPVLAKPSLGSIFALIPLLSLPGISFPALRGSWRPAGPCRREALDVCSVWVYIEKDQRLPLGEAKNIGGEGSLAGTPWQRPHQARAGGRARAVSGPRPGAEGRRGRAVELRSWS